MSILAFLFVVSAAQSASPAAAPAKVPAASTAASRAEAYYHYSLGLQARLAGDSDEALAEYRRAQKLDPASAAIRVEAARLLRETGRLEEATAEVQAAVALDKDDADAHLVLAQLHQVQAAGPEAEAALAPRRDGVRAGGTAPARRRPVAAEPCRDLRPAAGPRRRGADVGEVPGDRPRQLRGARPARHPPAARGRVRAGRSGAQGRLELQPGSARAYQMLGEIYARAEQSDQAVLHYRKALEIEPDNVRVRLALGEVLQQSKRPEEALAEAEAVLKADASNRFALDLKGRCLRDLKRYDDADTVGRRAARRRSRRPQGRLPEGHGRRVAARLRRRGSADRAACSAARGPATRTRPPTSACSCCTSASPTSS